MRTDAERSGINGAGTSTQKAKGITDNGEIFLADTLKGGAKKPEIAKVTAAAWRMAWRVAWMGGVKCWGWLFTAINITSLHHVACMTCRDHYGRRRIRDI